MGNLLLHGGDVLDSQKVLTKRKQRSETCYNNEESNDVADVIVKKSRIEGGGLGLFTGKPFKKNQVINYYSGSLVDGYDAQYEDPTYFVSFQYGKGFKIKGDTLDGDLGVYANSIHPDFKFPKQNARLAMGKKKQVISRGAPSIKNENLYMPGQQFRFPIVATEDLFADTEVIVDYGSGHFTKVREWKTNPPKPGCSDPPKPGCSDRSLRASKRARCAQVKMEV